MRCIGTPARRKADSARPSASPMKGMFGDPGGLSTAVTRGAPTVVLPRRLWRSYPWTQVWKVLGGTWRYTAASLVRNSGCTSRGSSLESWVTFATVGYSAHGGGGLPI